MRLQISTFHVIIIIVGPYKATRLCMHIKPELQVNLIFF